MDAQSAIIINEGLRFYTPYWLFGIVIIPSIYIILRFIKFKKKQTVYSTQVSILIKNNSTWVKKDYYIVPLLRVLALVMLCIALARPQAGSQIVTKSLSQINIMVVLDLSNSMNANDIKPTRLKAAKQILMDFIDKRANDRLGLIGFSGKSFTLMPITNDYQALKIVISQASTKIIAIDGTAIGDALLNAANRLLQVSQAEDKQKGVVILATDGINTQGVKPVPAAKILAKKKIKLYAIGLGGDEPVLRYDTDWEGRLIPKKDIYGQLQYWSKPDHHVLEKIAQIANGKYFNASNKTEFEAVMQEINRLEKQAFNLNRQKQSKELYYWPLLAAVFLLVIERFFSRIRYLDYT